MPIADASRRDFLALMGFSLGAAACSRGATQQAVPFVTAPEDLTPGVPNWYATTCGGCSASCSVLVKTRDGRPIKIEGNPDAPLFGGGTCAVGQATVLSLYDGQRLQQPLWRGAPVSWQEVDDAIESHLRDRVRGAGTRGAALRHDHEPLHAGHHRALVEARPDSGTWCTSRSRTRRSVAPTSACFNRAVVPHYRFDKAALIVGFEADFLGTWLSPVEFTAQYARRRQPGSIDGAPRAVRVDLVAHRGECGRAPRGRAVSDRPRRAGAARSRAVAGSRSIR